MPFKKKFDIRGNKSFDTCYGENPHQRGAFCIKPGNKDPLAIQKFKKIQGKEISFNNLLDINGAVLVISHLGGKRPACAILKHGNPCGAAYGKDTREAFYRSWYIGDSLAAFGGIIIVNRPVDRGSAKLILKDKFFEVLLAPKIKKEALNVFSQRKNLIILVNPALKNPQLSREANLRQVRGGFLIQDSDLKQITERDLKIVTGIKPTKKQTKDLLFAWKICKVSKSNAIVVARDETLISSGVGQQDRKRCCELVILKAGRKAKGAAAASDGFFPFPDGPEILIKRGVKAIIQPGGSIRDKETINLCNKYKVPMVITNIRCFNH